MTQNQIKAEIERLEQMWAARTNAAGYQANVCAIRERIAQLRSQLGS